MLSIVGGSNLDGRLLRNRVEGRRGSLGGRTLSDVVDPACLGGLGDGSGSRRLKSGGAECPSNTSFPSFHNFLIPLEQTQGISKGSLCILDYTDASRYRHAMPAATGISQGSLCILKMVYATKA